MLNHWLVRIALVALVMAAALTVAMVVFDSFNVAPQLIWTAIATGITPLILLGILQRMMIRSTPSSIWVALSVVTVCYVYLLLLIWDVPGLLLSLHYESTVPTFMTMLGCGLVGAAFYDLSTKPHMRIAGWIGVVASCGTFIFALFAYWGPAQLDDQWGQQALATAGHGLTLAGLFAGRSRSWIYKVRLLGVLLIATAYYCTTAHLWQWHQKDDNLVVILTAAGIATAYANLILLVPLKKQWRVLAYVSIAIWMGACTMVALAIITYNMDHLDDIYNRLAVGACILAIASTLAIAIVSRAMKTGHFSAPVVELEHNAIRFACPVCDTQQDIPTGDSACVDCGTRFQLRVTEPHCPQCDYLLFRNDSPNCPECGANITFKRGVRV